jgi:sec-independent protein translocase protein TatB
MGIGFIELVVIALVALVLLGPQRIPEVLRQIAKVYVHLRRSSNDLKSAFDHVVHEAETELRRTELDKLKVSLEPVLDQTSSVTDRAASSPNDSVASTPAPARSPHPGGDWESQGSSSASEPLPTQNSVLEPPKA